MQTDEPLLIPQNLLADTKFVDIEENSSILYRLKELMKKSGFTGNIIINEWNLVPDPREAVNDTCFKAAYFAASMLKLDGLVQAVAYWVFSDIFEEISFKEEPFHGGIGFITRTGLKKPVYYVYELMNRLLHNVIARGEFFIVTRSEEGIISFFAYNYCTIKDYKFGRKQPANREGCYEESVREFCLDIDGCQGHYVQNCYRVNREEGSVYDTWIKMGAPKTIRQEQLRFLGNKSLYHFDTQEIFALNQVSLPVRLQPHEVMLIEWVPIHTK